MRIMLMIASHSSNRPASHHKYSQQNSANASMPLGIGYLLLILLVLQCLWLNDRVAEARQEAHKQHQQLHNEEQINESAGVGGGSSYHRRRGGGGGLASYEIYESNNSNNHNHNRNKNKHNNQRNNNFDDGEGASTSLDGHNTYSNLGKGNKSGENGHRRGHRKKHNRAHNSEDNISLWINEQQLKMLTALFFPQTYFQGRIYAIHNGHVAINDLLEGRIYEYLVIPPEVNYVNFTWKSGYRKYFYNFDLLESLDESILKAPTVSIKTKGRIPKEEKNFSVFLPCSGNNSGTASFNVGLTIHNRSGQPLPGTPLRLNFKKECAHRGVYDSLLPDASHPSSTTTLITSMQGPDPECSLKCGEHGYCNHGNICQCHSGYIGQYCENAFCFPQCMNGGKCTAPAVCTCPDGYQGSQCEGGICKEKCLNGGKCVQKDKCQCPRGYYGLRCEFSKCEISCMHGGRCIGTNMCRCAEGLSGNHCEITEMGRRQRGACKRKCKHGECMPNKTCKCKDGFFGRFCNRRVKH